MINKKIEVSEKLFLYLRKRFAGDIFTQQVDNKFYVKGGTATTKKEINTLL